MLTIFNCPNDSKEFYFKLNASLQITNNDLQSRSCKFAGLYAIFKDGICYYVGQSQNLASRLSTHLTGRYSSFDGVIIISPIKNSFSDFYARSSHAKAEILEYNEQLLINGLKPVENIIVEDVTLIEEKAFGIFVKGADGQKDADAFIMKGDGNIAVSCKMNFHIENQLMAFHNEKVIQAAEQGEGNVSELL